MARRPRMLTGFTDLCHIIDSYEVEVASRLSSSTGGLHCNHSRCELPLASTAHIGNPSRWRLVALLLGSVVGAQGGDPLSKSILYEVTALSIRNIALFPHA